MFGVDAGTLEQKGSCCKQFWNIWRLCRSGASRRSNVATSPRRDIPTSRRWVNYCASQQAATSRRQCEFCFPSIKSKWRRGFGGIGRRTTEGTEFLSRPRPRSDPIGESEPVSGCETIYWDSLIFFFFYQQPFTIKNELPPEWYPLKFIHIY